MQIVQKMSMSLLRALIGFLVAPGAPALFSYLVGLFFASHWEAAFVPKILAMFGYAAALLIGVPGYFLLQRIGVNSFMGYLILGALIGLTVYVLFFGVWALQIWDAYPEHTLLLLKDSVGSGVVAVVYATVASAVFWLIAIRQPT